MDDKAKKVFESKILLGVLYGIGIVVVALLIFAAGMDVGFRKAGFARNWGEHYNENFGMGRPDMPMAPYFPDTHGATGKIIKLELPTMLVTGKDNIEKSVLINDDTKIEKGGDEIKTTDLKVDDFVIVIGSPNQQGQIEAKLIRMLPAPEAITPTTK